MRGTAPLVAHEGMVLDLALSDDGMRLVLGRRGRPGPAVGPRPGPGVPREAGTSHPPRRPALAVADHRRRPPDRLRRRGPRRPRATRGRAGRPSTSRGHARGRSRRCASCRRRRRPRLLTPRGPHGPALGPRARHGDRPVPDATGRRPGRHPPGGDESLLGEEGGRVRRAAPPRRQGDRPPRRRRGQITALALAPDLEGLLSGSTSDGSLRLWDLPSARSLARVEGHAGPVYAVAIDPLGLRAISVGTDGGSTCGTPRPDDHSRDA